MHVIQTKRLLLRTWREQDALPYYTMNQDPKVLSYLPGPLSMERVHQFMFDMNKGFEQDGYCLWAVELKETEEFIGYVGLSRPQFEAHFTPCVEIGWRLDARFHNCGYATEAAKGVLEYAFVTCGLDSIVSFTVPENKASIRVMEKIGMQKVIGGEFAHPRLAKDHRLSYHVLYKITACDILKK